MARFVEILKIVLLGIVEGITEWLPVSSTGHMIILDKFISLSVREEIFEIILVVIQLGAALAVPIALFDTIRSAFYKRRGGAGLLLMLLVGILPAAVFGFFLDDYISEHLFGHLTVALALIFYGIAFIVIERWARAARVSEISGIAARDALSIGLFQALALIPGTSRSGATIVGGMLFGVSRSVSAEFSFLMAIPIMLGASALKIIKFFLSGLVISRYEMLLIFIGAAVAFLVSLITIRFLIGFVREHTLTVFGIYRIILGLLVLLIK